MSDLLMPEDIKVEQMKLSEKDDVLAFLRKAYSDNPRHSDRDFWSWHFPDSPYCDPENLPVWLAKSGSRIVGQLAATPVELNVGSRSVPAIWILDLIVDPAFRRMGIAKKLALASTQFCPYVLGINTSAQHSTELLQGLGWLVFTKIPRFQKILFPGNAIPEIARVKLFRSAVNFAFAPLRPNLKRAVRGSANVSVIEAIDSRFDDLWDEAHRQWPCAVSRTAAILDWQFRKQPGKAFTVLGYFEESRLRGYLVLFFRKADKAGSISKAAISDVCYHPQNARGIVDGLLHGAVKIAIERRAGSLVTDAIDSLLDKRLRHFGFRRVKSDLQLLAKVPDYRELICDPANWYLTRGDSDISIFEDPNLPDHHSK